MGSLTQLGPIESRYMWMDGWSNSQLFFTSLT